MSAADALAGWLVVNVCILGFGSFAAVLWCQYERDAARRRARMRRPTRDAIGAQDRARAMEADIQILLEIETKFNREQNA